MRDELVVRLARIGIPALLGLLLAWYLVSGQILLYIHERSTWLVALSIPVLFAIACVHVRSARSLASDRVALVSLAVPLIVGLIVPGRPLGSTAIDNQASASAATAPWQPTASFDIDTRNATWDMGQLMRVEAADPELHGFEGQRASLVGFVYRTLATPVDQFHVSRFVIRCCTADAVAVSFPIHYDRARDLARDTWVEVAGQIHLSGSAEPPRPFLEADSVKVIPQPSQPYLNP